jgi:hypothetical protein
MSNPRRSGREVQAKIIFVYTIRPATSSTTRNSPLNDELEASQDAEQIINPPVEDAELPTSALLSLRVPSRYLSPSRSSTTSSRKRSRGETDQDQVDAELKRIF